MNNKNKLDISNFLDLVLNFGHKSRFTQDTPILPEVWLTYASNPVQEKKPVQDKEGEFEPCRHDLILTPDYSSKAIDVAEVLRKPLEKQPDARLAALRSDIGVALTFGELIAMVLPLTTWWHQQDDRLQKLFDADGVNKFLNRKGIPLHQVLEADENQAQWQFIILVIIVSYLNRPMTSSGQLDRVFKKVNELIRLILDHEAEVGHVKDIYLARPAKKLLKDLSQTPRGTDKASKSHADASGANNADDRAGRQNMPACDSAKIWAVNINRPISLSLDKSRLTVKADAAERVFDHDACDIVWAVMDSGIDATHPAFAKRREDGSIDSNSWHDRKRRRINPLHSRVHQTYDFTLLRDIAAANWGTPSERLLARLRRNGKSPEELRQVVIDLKKRLTFGRELDWAFIAPLLKLSHEPDLYVPRPARGGEARNPGFVPGHPHGTHVAGIVGGDLRTRHGSDIVDDLDSDIRGVCPTIRFFDLRVCDKNGAGDEFVILAALQFISYLNRDRDLMRVHGVNISLSLRHMVANFACGQTPVCQECSRVLGDRVVVVAAAGNGGYQRLQSEHGMVEMYNPISITDPGNAEDVITVGSTHRERPHAYGISYFSSRGPTADGRYKPDILAPGERIISAIPGAKVKSMDGTSMAAPHVSGAAAMLMARHKELKGNPHKIKQILCNSATDLGRDRYFQGAGLLDILRAIQSV